jgi:regulator of protease activity HflC (stomatin/prohibitin superfamily)
MGLIITLISVLMFLGAIAATAAFFAWRLFDVEKETIDPETNRRKMVNEPMPGRKLVGVLAIVLALSFVGLSGVKIIEPGNVGIVVTAGTVDHNERQSGITWVRPFIDDVVIYSTRQEVRTFDKLAAASKEYQDVFLTGVLQYNVDPKGASELYVGYNNDFVNQTLFPKFSDSIKTVTPKYAIGEILPNRETIRAETLVELRKRLVGSGINVVDISLEQVAFNPEYEDAIKQKQVEFEKIATERNILSQSQVRAEQAKAVAKGEADAAIEKAKGEAEAVLLKRQAEADGNKAVADSLTENILRQRSIDKVNPNVRIILMPADAQDFIFPPEMLAEPTPAP